MGTNYYIKDKTNYCECCGRGEEEIHLGKSSMGWHFSLHIYPEDNINNFDDVLKMIGDRKIYDEYGREISKIEFKDIVTKRSRDKADKPSGYNTWSDFHKQNHSEDGLNGLIRGKISSFCIGHGKGTYDYCVGEFC